MACAKTVWTTTIRIDQLEARIRAKASQLDEARRIHVQQVEK
ncbi:hypothetical protein ACLB1O_03135 [Escherichia coli]